MYKKLCFSRIHAQMGTLLMLTMNIHVLSVHVHMYVLIPAEIEV